jgi:hypothetical protein
MLWMLRDLLADRGDDLPAAEREQFRRLLDVPASISESMTQFTTDPEPILEHRRQVAEAIETLSVGER